uniref:snRNA-activating protein complex subunit 3 n=2 Tax=Oryzias latipes TaxID=8090 RepID=A0A3B3HWS1_ORYLA
MRTLGVFVEYKSFLKTCRNWNQQISLLRDAICCISDLQVCGDFSRTPDMAPDFLCKDHFKSAFFFFEGVFYNDMRFPECQDISITTINWAKSHNFPPFTQAKMEDTLLQDLKLKVGFPMYCHQGICEHLVITDVRSVLPVLLSSRFHLKKAPPLFISRSGISLQLQLMPIKLDMKIFQNKSFSVEFSK